MQDGLLAVDDERMPGIVSTLETRNRMRRVGLQLDYLAFALVAPLRPDDDYILPHDSDSL